MPFCKWLAQNPVADVHASCLIQGALKHLVQRRLSNAWNGNWIVAVLQLALFLFVLAMTQIQSLHHAYHPDAANPAHQCVVTMLQGGQVDAPNCDAAIVPAVVQGTTHAGIESFFVPSVDYSLPPSCGPPGPLS
jgi:hypothetical protein